MDKINPKKSLKEIDHYLKKLFPLNRSLTGEANRKTLKILNEIVPIKIIEYRSGKKVYDWKIPKEWNLKDGWIKDEKGKKIVDFKNCNLHVVSYSHSIHKKIKIKDLKKNLYYHDKINNAIPYRTSYYKESWGFCITKKQFEKIERKSQDTKYEVYINSSLSDKGSLTIGETIIPGKSKKEFLISTYICHPSMANDNLSGMIMTALLARELKKIKNNFYTYRVIWAPETIGAISYCYNNQKKMRNIKNGLVISNIGGKGKFGYKQSIDENDSLNLSIENVFKKQKIKYIKYPFDINGSDERQFSSVGFRINTPLITKDKFYEYPLYHSSQDNLDFVKPENIFKSLKLHIDVIAEFEDEIIFKNKKICEPLLSKYKLYPSLGGSHIPEDKKLDDTNIILWLCNLSDGHTTISQIVRKLNLPEQYIMNIAEMLCKKGILGRVK